MDYKPGDIAIKCVIVTIVCIVGLLFANTTATHEVLDLILKSGIYLLGFSKKKFSVAATKSDLYPVDGNGRAPYYMGNINRIKYM